MVHSQNTKNSVKFDIYEPGKNNISQHTGGGGYLMIKNSMFIDRNLKQNLTGGR